MRDIVLKSRRFLAHPVCRAYYRPKGLNFMPSCTHTNAHTIVYTTAAYIIGLVRRRSVITVGVAQWLAAFVA